MNGEVSSLDTMSNTVVTEAVKSLSAQEISELCVRHTLYDWSAQSALKPMAVASAKGVRFKTVDGRSFLDFNSQLMSVNAGHGDRRIIDAIKAQADRLPYISPFLATEVRARLGQKLAELLPGDIDKVFFTLGGTEANENAIKMARAVTGRPKILARYRSYHGSTGSAVQATGDPRRLAQPEHFLDAHRQHRRAAWLVAQRDAAAARYGQPFRRLALHRLPLGVRQPALQRRQPVGGPQLRERTPART